MSDADTRPERAELVDRIESLEQRVAELEDSLSFHSAAAGLDRYDRLALEALEMMDQDTFRVPDMAAAYRKSGIKNKEKIRQRVKDLKRSDVATDHGFGDYSFDFGGVGGE